MIGASGAKFFHMGIALILRLCESYSKVTNFELAVTSRRINCTYSKPNANYCSIVQKQSGCGEDLIHGKTLAVDSRLSILLRGGTPGRINQPLHFEHPVVSFESICKHSEIGTRRNSNANTGLKGTLFYKYNASEL